MTGLICISMRSAFRMYQAVQYYSLNINNHMPYIRGKQLD